MLGAIGRAAEAVELGLARFRPYCLALFSAVFLTVFGHRAANRPFWFDELFTYYLTIRPTVADLMQQLADGVDQQPLPYYLLHRAFLLPSGEGQPLLWLRVPEMLGVLLAACCVFAIVRRRSSDLVGWIAVLLLLNTQVTEYAYEARPYGLVVGFTALATLAYLRAVDGARRRLWLAVLALALLAAVSSSYYAVLAFFAFGLAEVVRLIDRRRIDWGVTAALGAASLGPLLYAPLAMGQVATFDRINWASPSFGGLIKVHHDLIGQLVTPAVLLLLVWGAREALGSRMENRGEGKGGKDVPIADLAVAVGLATLPLVLYVVAKLVTHKLHARYALESTIGFSILGAHLCAGWVRRNGPACGLCLAAVLAGFLMLTELTRSLAATGAPGMDAELARWLEDQPPELPIAVDDPIANLELAHRNLNGIRERLFYVVDVENARRLAPSIVRGGRSWLRNRRVMPIQAVKRTDFPPQHREFLLYRDSPEQSYLLELSREQGAEVQLLHLGAVRARALYRVRYP